VCAVADYNDRARSKRAVLTLFARAISAIDQQLAQAVQAAS
jgi:hypothetical protein